MDTLTITGLSVAAKIGIHAWEKQINQKLLIDIHIQSDLQHCEEDIHKTIDYDKLCQTVCEYVENQSFNLIETVATGIACLLHEQFALQEFSVSVSKPHAIKNAQNIKVTIHRKD